MNRMAGNIELHVAPYERRIIVDADVTHSRTSHDLNLTVYCHAGSHVTYISAITDAARSVQNLRFVLLGPKARVVVRGLYMLNGDQNVVINTVQEHQHPETLSDVLFKGVVGGMAQATYHGTIKIAPAASRSQARQFNTNLVTGDHARIWVQTVPSLEVLTNDVRCAHGSAVGQLDPLHLLYMQSRGVDLAEAQRLLVKGFIADILKEGGTEDLLCIEAAIDRKIVLLLR